MIADALMHDYQIDVRQFYAVIQAKQFFAFVNYLRITVAIGANLLYISYIYISVASANRQTLVSREELALKHGATLCGNSFYRRVVDRRHLDCRCLNIVPA